MEAGAGISQEQLQAAAQKQQEAAEQKEAIKQQRSAFMNTLLDEAARTRLANIAAAKPEKAE